MPVRYLSVCSGIEAASVAWEPLGWVPAAFSEIEPFPRCVLAHRFPEIPVHGDFTTIQAGQFGPIDLLVGGTPCQSFSVGGLRKGMAVPRGNLALGYLALLDRERPRWCVWENVPGALSSNGGRDFGAFLGGLGQLGYGWAYRVLDAQYFGVPQQRRRVFVVGCAGGDWRRAAAVLFERESMRGDTALGRAPGEGIAQAFAGSPYGDRGDGDHNRLIAGTLLSKDGNVHADEAWTNQLVAFTPLRASGSATANGGGIGEAGDPSLTLDYDGSMAAAFEPRFARNGRGAPSDVVPALKAQTRSSGKGDAAACIAFRGRGSNIDLGQDVMGTLGTNRDRAAGGAPCVATGGVRRLTPRECERLQGFPDDWTLIPGAADGPRYKAIGNSMAVPVMRWIGGRIAMVDALDIPLDQGA